MTSVSTMNKEKFIRIFYNKVEQKQKGTRLRKTVCYHFIFLKINIQLRNMVNLQIRGPLSVCMR